MLLKNLTIFLIFSMNFLINLESHATPIIYSTKPAVESNHTESHKAPPTYPVEADFQQKVNKTILGLHTAFSKSYPDVKADEASVSYFDGFIHRNAQALDKRTKDGVGFGIGILLGQAMIEKYGGEWVYVGENKTNLAVKLGKGEHNFIAFPITKTFKQLENGDEDSILSFYQTTATLLKLSQDGKFD